MIYSKNDTYTLYQGKMQDVLTNEIEKESIDCIITDPPYELNFMGKGWDNTGVAFQKDTWKKCYDVLKWGGDLLVFGGSRTYHRIACAIEDAGFEIRDCIMWLYGSGFPKSNDLSKSIEAKLTTGSANTREFKNLNGKQTNRGNYGYAKMQYEQGARNKDYNIDCESKTYLSELEPTTELAKKWKGWGSCLKPAYEPIIIARKPFKGSLVDNVIQYGVGGINIDECRVGNEYFNQKEHIFNTYGIYDTHVTPAKEYYGRFPANVITDGSDEVARGMPNTISRFDENNRQETEIHRVNNDILTYGYKQRVAGGFNDSGSAMRYFYCAKASTKDRVEGLENFEKTQIGVGANYSNSETARMFGAKPAMKKNIHPTVKPVELMQYLVRLVAPKGATILDCFMGSGSTGKAVMFENRERNANYKFIGVEMTEEYLPIASARIDYAKNKYEYDEKKAKQEDKAKGIQNIFDFMEEK